MNVLVRYPTWLLTRDVHGSDAGLMLHKSRLCAARMKQTPRLDQRAREHNNVSNITSVSGAESILLKQRNKHLRKLPTSILQ